MICICLLTNSPQDGFGNDFYHKGQWWPHFLTHHWMASALSVSEIWILEDLKFIHLHLWIYDVHRDGGGGNADVEGLSDDVDDDHHDDCSDADNVDGDDDGDD